MGYVRVDEDEQDPVEVNLINALDEPGNDCVLELAIIKFKALVNLPWLILLDDGLVDDVVAPGGVTVEDCCQRGTVGLVNSQQKGVFKALQ